MRSPRFVPSPTHVSDAPAPPGYLVIEAAGKYLIPGLIDLHVHLINTGGLAPPGAETTEAILDQMVRYGVTTALLTGGPAANDEQATELAKRQRAREIVAPLLFGAGDSFTVPGSHPVSTIMPELENATPEELHENGVAVITPDSDIRGLIGRKKRLGLFGVKILVEDGPAPWYPKPRMSLETARRIVDVAGKEGLPVLAHALSLDALRDAVEADVDAIMHSVNEPIPLGDPVIRRLREADTTYLTTLSVQFASVVIGEPERLEEPFLEAGVSPRALRSLANPLFRLYWSRVIGDLDPSVLLGHAMANVALLHDAGVRIALGSDSGGLPAAFPGHSAHVELALIVPGDRGNGRHHRAGPSGESPPARCESPGRHPEHTNPLHGRSRWQTHRTAHRVAPPKRRSGWHFCVTRTPRSANPDGQERLARDGGDPDRDCELRGPEKFGPAHSHNNQRLMTGTRARKRWPSLNLTSAIRLACDRL
jgi:imidazolonepropionase-like amidohydrolase